MVETAVDNTDKAGSRSPGLVVGIGASAGGLQAFKEFLAHIPVNSGMAFVLLPHLDPKHVSMMTELLADQAGIPVCQIQDGQVVEANRVYILPPASELTIENGVLHLFSIKDTPHPWVAVDRFFRSLAADRDDRAVGIILSGTGSHGILGIKDIKRAGGLVLAQTPESSDYSQMPVNAIASGYVDRVMTPAEMPAALVEYASHPYLHDPAAEKLVAEEEINCILSILRSRTKYDFREYRRNMLVRRILRRMSLGHIETLEKYQQYLRSNPDEVAALNKDLLISVTAFFRDPEAFHVLEQRVIRDLIEHNTEEEPLRIWVPGCASGEEAYSLAMLLVEGFDAARKLPNFQIFATDIDEDSLVVARAGEYPEAISVDVSPERLKRFFVKTDSGKYKIRKSLRDTIVFAAHNLIGDAPFSRMHLISCRNLFIYLQPELQAKVIQLFHFSLRESGYLLLGPSESIGRQAELFEVISKKWRIFRRILSGARNVLDIPARGGSLVRTVPDEILKSQEARLRRPNTSVVELAQKVLLANYVPASVLINRHYDILNFYGSTSNYLQLPSGEPTNNLMDMARESLGASIRIAVHRALQEKQPVTDADAIVKRNGQDVSCTLTVRPIAEPKEAEGLLLVSFEDNESVAKTGNGRNKKAAVAIKPPSRKELKIIEQLENEIKATREDLQSSIEELESSNEELKVSNEEIMSMNEELQSANEELESSKEELQSMNEELNTVNVELQCKVDELEKSHDDVSNLLASTDIATLFLDRDMCIKLFNPPICDLLNLRKGDVDRPISDFSGKVNTEQLLQDARQVLEKLVPVEREVLVGSGPQSRCYLQRVVPYRTVADRIAGAVITFIDITDRHQIEVQLERRVAERTAELNSASAILKDREERLSAIMQYMADAIIVVDGSGAISECNPATERIFGYSASEIVAEKMTQLIPVLPYAKEERRRTINQIPLSSGLAIERREYKGRRKDGTVFPLELKFTEIDHLGLFIGIIRDISERRKLEEEVAEISTREQENTGRELHDGLGQQLTGLNMLAASLRQSLAQAGASDTRLLDEIIVQLKAAAGEVSRISHGLAPISITPEGLPDALARLVHSMAGNGQVNCRFESDGVCRIEDQTVANHLYRIAQEAFNNALKYAHAKNILLSLRNAGEVIELCVTDDGGGFTVEEKLTPEGVGLRVMYYRAKVIGAHLSIDSAPGQGTTVACQLRLSGKP